MACWCRSAVTTGLEAWVHAWRRPSGGWPPQLRTLGAPKPQRSAQEHLQYPCAVRLLVRELRDEEALKQGGEAWIVTFHARQGGGAETGDDAILLGHHRCGAPATHATEHLGDADAVLLPEETGSLKKGTKSTGVKRCTRAWPDRRHAKRLRLESRTPRSACSSATRAGTGTLGSTALAGVPPRHDLDQEAARGRLASAQCGRGAKRPRFYDWACRRRGSSWVPARAARPPLRRPADRTGVPPDPCA